jgi:UDP:flavonoid glycosyltransferase YjiC (YdhE family)
MQQHNPVQMKPKQASIILLTIVITLNLANGYQLMFMPLSERTHMLVHLKLATVLAQRGHSIHFITADCHQAFAEQKAAQMAPNATVQFVTYSMDCSYHEHEKAAARLLSPLGEVKAIYRNVVGRSDDLLSQPAVMQQLSALAPKTDLLVSDIFSFGMLLAAKLNLAHIDIDVGTAGSLWEPDLYGAETGASYIPAVGSFFPTTGMQLWQRAANLIMTTVIRTLIRAAFWYPGSSLQHVVRKHSIPLQWPYTHPLMLLVNSNFATEPPRAVPPNIHYIGPILPEPAQALPEDLEAFLSASGSSGAVLVSFGGTLQAPLAASKALVSAMSALQPIRFVWKVSKTDQEALAAATNVTQLFNVFLSDWLPQNDLLGHPQVRVFVTQGGYLSMGEAAYHGVPILGLPFIPGQAELIRFAFDQGRALFVPTKGLEQGSTAPTVQALQQLLQDSSYAAAAQVVSRRLKAAQRPYKEQAADWVEYAAAVKDDGPFLYPVKLQQQWFQQAMLDVLLLYAVATAAAALLVLQLLRLLVGSVQQRRRRHLHAAGVPGGAGLRSQSSFTGSSSSNSGRSNRSKGGRRSKAAGAVAHVTLLTTKGAARKVS